ncbi:MAG: NAD(P)(+) transhydrogenase (Re/Si-specific) subunit beta [Myxococcota bacterium]
MESTLLSVAYLGAGVLFILSLGGLSTQESAQRGNRYGIIGMIIALAATLLHEEIGSYVGSANGAMAATIGVGSVIGFILAQRVKMTEMPELVAILHSFVGLAAVLVGFSSFLAPIETLEGSAHTIHSIEIYIDIVIGALTFTGSVVAWVKLRGKLFGKWISGKALILPGRHLLNIGMLVAMLAIAVPVVGAATPDAMAFGVSAQLWLVVSAVIAGVLGIHLVLSIGGADMPVVVSLLNSYSGWTASAAGFMLSNNLLIITGALVGSSGAILSYIMCKAMNRSIWNVVFGNFGAAASTGPATQVDGEMVEIETDDLVQELKDAKEVIIVPGYGMAVAQAQRSVDTFTRLLKKSGKNVRFAIHPVAGRLPGHMNVLLAEAGVSYDIVLEMDEINDDFPETDVVLVIGANDIVNPSAQTDPNSPIAGMPVLEAWKATRTVVFKRGRGKGYAGVVNPLFYDDNTRMFFGDALASMDKLNAQLNQ